MTRSLGLFRTQIPQLVAIEKLDYRGPTMSLKILGDDSAAIIDQMRSAIEAAIACRELSIDSGSPGHFAIRVVSDAFVDLGRVKQQQLVYGAIAHLMKGDGAPVHAIDHLECVKP